MPKFDIGAKIRLITTGNTIKHVLASDIQKLKIYFPSLTEQSKIASFFTKLEKLIDLQQSRLKHLKRLKQGYLQKLFTNENSDVPKMRFKEFHDSWVNKKIKDVTTREDNKRIPITASQRIKGTTRYYGANGVQDYVNGYTHKGDYVLIAEDGASSILDYPIYSVHGYIWVNNHAHVLSTHENQLDNDFLSYRLKTISFYSYLTGTGRYKLNADVMEQINIKIPSIEEQSKIASLLEKLDQQITLNEDKLNHLKQVKRGYLQKMFI